jgi:hypothetical protein
MRHARTQADINRLYGDADLPVRGGCSDRLDVAYRRKAVGT